MSDVAFECDKWVWRKRRCRRKPHCEVYPRNGTWSYLCRWHYWMDRLKHKKNGYYILDEDDKRELK